MIPAQIDKPDFSFIIEEQELEIEVCSIDNSKYLKVEMCIIHLNQLMPKEKKLTLF